MLYCRAKPPVCFLPKMLSAWIACHFFLKSLSEQSAFSPVIGFVLSPRFVSLSLCSNVLSSPVCFLNPMLCLLFSFSLPFQSLFETLYTVLPLLSDCIYLIPLPFGAFFSLPLSRSSASFSAFVPLSLTAGV